MLLVLYLILMFKIKSLEVACRWAVLTKLSIPASVLKRTVSMGLDRRNSLWTENTSEYIVIFF
jgi:hypothetical protein